MGCSVLSFERKQNVFMCVYCFDRFAALTFSTMYFSCLPAVERSVSRDNLSPVTHTAFGPVGDWPRRALSQAQRVRDWVLALSLATVPGKRGLVRNDQFAQPRRTSTD